MATEKQFMIQISTKNSERCMKLNIRLKCYITVSYYYLKRKNTTLI